MSACADDTGLCLLTGLTALRSPGSVLLQSHHGCRPEGTCRAPQPPLPVACQCVGLPPAHTAELGESPKALLAT